MEELDTLVELNEYVDLCNDEWGEYCFNLVTLYNSMHDDGDEFKEEVFNRITEALEFFKNNSEILTEVKTNTYKAISLVWNDEQ